MYIVYIHGNGATPDSFNFIRMHLRSYKETLIRYDSRNGFYHNLTEMLGKLRAMENIFFIAHSLGGIYAVHLANQLGPNVLGAAVDIIKKALQEVASRRNAAFLLQCLFAQLGAATPVLCRLRSFVLKRQ